MVSSNSGSLAHAAAVWVFIHVFVKEPIKKAALAVEPTKKKGLSYKEQQLFIKTEQEIKELEQERKDLELSLSLGELSQEKLVQKSQRIGEVIEKS